MKAQTGVFSDLSRLAKVFLVVKVFFLATAAAPANPAAVSEGAVPQRVAVVTGDACPALESIAARELTDYLRQLFSVEAEVVSTGSDAHDFAFLVGTPQSNPAVAEALDGKLPELSDQGLLIRSAKFKGRPALIISGGSPRAVLWSTYELVQRWGVHYTLHGDILPAKSDFRARDLDLVLEPKLRVRQWRVVNEMAVGPISWGLADYRPLIKQLAKLKFNRMLFSIWPSQPFVPFEYQGVKRESGTIFFGYRFPITDDMVGRELFGDDKEIWNPDLPMPDDYASFESAAVNHVRGLMEMGKELGMSCVFHASVTEFPTEFRRFLEHTEPVELRNVGFVTVGPGPKGKPDDQPTIDLASAFLESIKKTYPLVDYIELGTPEHREWTKYYEHAWHLMDEKHGIGRVRSLDETLAAVERRKDYPGGIERATKEVRADIVGLHFNSLVVENARKRNPALFEGVNFVISGFAEEVLPLVPLVMPEGSEILAFIDYTPNRIVKRKEVLGDVPADKIPASLIYTLHDDNVGLLPQITAPSLEALTRELLAKGWAGFSTRFWLLSDHDFCVEYLSRAAWDDGVELCDVYRDAIETLCGRGAVDDMLVVFREVEEATRILEWHGMALSFPVPQMMMWHWDEVNVPAEQSEAADHYLRAYQAALKALPKCESQAGSEYVFYWIGRLRFGMAYMQAVEAVRRGGAAETGGDVKTALSEARSALEAVWSGLREYASAARDLSDRNAVAVMNEFVYRPLRAKVRELQEKRDEIALPAVRAKDFESR